MSDSLELEQFVREWADVVREVRADLRSLRAELENARVIAVPMRTAAVRTVHQVPAGHHQGHCEQCDGYHPIDGAPPEKGS